MKFQRQRIAESIGLSALLSLGLTAEDLARGVYAGLFAMPLLAIMFYRMWPWLQTRREEAGIQPPQTWQDVLKSSGVVITVVVVVIAIGRWLFPGSSFDGWDALRTLSFLALVIYPQWPLWVKAWQRWRACPATET